MDRLSQAVQGMFQWLPCFSSLATSQPTQQALGAAEAFIGIGFFEPAGKFPSVVGQVLVRREIVGVGRVRREIFWPIFGEGLKALALAADQVVNVDRNMARRHIGISHGLCKGLMTGSPGLYRLIRDSFVTHTHFSNYRYVVYDIYT